MSDARDHLGEALERIADEARPADVMPDVVRRRVRRRQTGTALAAVFMIAAVSAGGFLGVRSLGRSSQRAIRPPVPSPLVTRSIRPTPTTQPVRCGSGWVVEPSPKVPGDHLDVLFGASALSSNDVWAVGRRFVTDSVADPTFALIEHWDGRSWSIVPGAEQHGRSASLAAVLALSRNDVWAVGKYEATSSLKSREDPLIEHWDGRAWNIVAAPPIGQDQDPGVARSLVAISAASPSDIWALGYYGASTNAPATVSRDAFLHWDGRSWRAVPSPQDESATGLSAMQDVSAVTSRDVLAVGTSFRGFGEAGRVAGALVERWDGRAWSRAAPPPGGLSLTRVAALAADDVWAVRGGTVATGAGFYGTGPAGVLHWDGRAWSTTLSLPSADGTTITDVTATGPNDVWVVGSEAGGPLVRHWDGRRWATPKGAEPPAGTRSISLDSVSRASGGAIIAFGSQQNQSKTAQSWLWVGCDRPSP